jgi:hypothetical protein
MVILSFKGWGLSPLDTRGYNIGFGITQRPQICRPSGYWTLRAFQGKARQIAANTKHGNETQTKREERSAKLAELYELEILGRELGLISGGMVGWKQAKS